MTLKERDTFCQLMMHMQVTFELHETFATPRRVIDQQPFEVTEFGWGEFDIGITVSQSEES